MTVKNQRKINCFRINFQFMSVINKLTVKTSQSAMLSKELQKKYGGYVRAGVTVIPFSVPCAHRH
jgi:hypothetical protein